MSKYQLAQLNIAEIKAPIDSPELKDFVDNLDRINALAESSPGFVWRLIGRGQRRHVSCGRSARTSSSTCRCGAM